MAIITKDNDEVKKKLFDTLNMQLEQFNEGKNMSNHQNTYCLTTELKNKKRVIVRIESILK